jgi:glyceraldehyde 3-phosphate dehydrogenase
MVKILLEGWGIESGFFMTVHAYTSTQSIVDQPMARNRRVCWAAAENIIPASSGAAVALKFIWPDLNMTGKAYRVPTRTGSIAEVTAILKKKATVEEVNEAFRKAAAKAPIKGVMGVFEEEWASARVVGNPLSSIVDLPITQIIDGKLISCAAWYDNEMGYSTRLAEVAAKINQ